MDYFSQRDKVVQERIDRVMADLPDFCKRFSLYCELKLSKLTESSYLYAIRQFFSYHAKQKNTIASMLTINDLNSITTVDIENWLTTFKGNIDMNTIIYRHSVMKTFLGYYYTRREIQQNVTEQILMPRLNEKPITRLTPHEVEQVLSAVETYDKRRNQSHILRDKTILTLFLSTGVRVSELVGLDLKHIDMENGSFIVTRKGGNIERLYMTDDLQIQLLYYLEAIDTSDENTPLFLSREKTRLADNSIRDMVVKYIEFAGIKKRITPHKLRSTFGTALHRKTKDIFVVAQILGHASVNTTRKYYVAMDEDIKRDAIAGFRY